MGFIGQQIPHTKRKGNSSWVKRVIFRNGWQGWRKLFKIGGDITGTPCLNPLEEGYWCPVKSKAVKLQKLNVMQDKLN